MIQYMGVLMGHKPFCEATNLTTENGLSDPWDFPGIPRDPFKKYMTRALYGSTKTPQETWKALKIKYTPEQVKIINKELKTGSLAVAGKFRDYIINNVQPKATMEIHIMDEVFTINCNRYKHVGDSFEHYKLYDSESDSIKSIIHTHTHKVPDLDRFRRFFVTLLVF